MARRKRKKPRSSRKTEASVTPAAAAVENDRTRKGRTARVWSALLLGFSGFFLALSPLNVKYPEPGQDPSWISALGEARRLGLRFGEDIIYTGGPLSNVYTGYFELSTYPYVAFVLVATCLAYALVTLAFVERAGTLRAAGPFVVVPILTGATGVRDAVMLGLPAITTLVTMGLRKSPFNWVLKGSAIVASAGLTLAKFTVSAGDRLVRSPRPARPAGAETTPARRFLPGMSRGPVLVAGGGRQLRRVFTG
jgi:hypothetical protein